MNNMCKKNLFIYVNVMLVSKYWLLQTYNFFGDNAILSVDMPGVFYLQALIPGPFELWDLIIIFDIYI